MTSRLVQPRDPRRARSPPPCRDSVTRAIGRILRGNLIVVDDIGLLGVTAGATVHRLLHHAHPYATTGDSFRLAQTTTGKGVTTLNP